MTGEQFIEKVREIKEISSVEWDVKGDYLNADEVRVKVVADNGEYNLLLEVRHCMTRLKHCYKILGWNVLVSFCW